MGASGLLMTSTEESRGPTTFERMEPVSKFSCLRILRIRDTQTGAPLVGPGGLQIQGSLPIVCISNNLLGDTDGPAMLRRPETSLIANACLRLIPALRKKRQAAGPWGPLSG